MTGTSAVSFVHNGRIDIRCPPCKTQAACKSCISPQNNKHAGKNPLRGTSTGRCRLTATTARAYRRPCTPATHQLDRHGAVLFRRRRVQLRHRCALQPRPLVPRQRRLIFMRLSNGSPVFDVLQLGQELLQRRWRLVLLRRVRVQPHTLVRQQRWSAKLRLPLPKVLRGAQRPRIRTGARARWLVVQLLTPQLSASVRCAVGLPLDHLRRLHWRMLPKG